MGTIRHLNAGTDELRKSASTINNLSTDIFKNYEAIVTLVDSELSDVWQGSGIDAFKAAIEGIKPAFNQLHELMNEYSEMLTNTATSYDSQEQELKSAAAGIKFE